MQDGAHLLEREGLRAMTAREEHEEAVHDAVLDSGHAEVVDDLEVKLLTVNVDRLNVYELSAAGRMDRILTAVLASSPDVIMLQEVVVEMYRVLQLRMQGRGWSIGRRRLHAEDYFNVITTRSAPEKTTSYCFSTSQQGRHLVTTRRGHWSLSNVHAESGGSQENRDERAAQLL